MGHELSDIFDSGFWCATQLGSRFCGQNERCAVPVRPWKSRMAFLLRRMDGPQVFVGLIACMSQSLRANRPRILVFLDMSNEVLAHILLLPPIYFGCGTRCCDDCIILVFKTVFF